MHDDIECFAAKRIRVKRTNGFSDIWFWYRMVICCYCSFGVCVSCVDVLVVILLIIITVVIVAVNQAIAYALVTISLPRSSPERHFDLLFT